VDCVDFWYGDAKGRGCTEARIECPAAVKNVSALTLYRNYAIFQGATTEGASASRCVGAMRRDKHSEIVERRARKSATYHKTFARTLHQIDLALLVREMREDAGLTQVELARKARTTQSAIARLEDAEYTGHSLSMLERVAAICGVALKLHAEKKPHFDREVALV